MAGTFRRLRVDQLNLPEPPVRASRRRLEELKASIEVVGVLVPLVVRALGKARKGRQQEYGVIAGAGRLQALLANGAGPATKVPCVVVDVDDAEATLLALVENTVREDMRPFDEAEVARVLVHEYGYTQQQVAQAIGRHQGRVSRLLAVYELDARAVKALRDGTLDMHTALALLPLVDDKPMQRSILTRALREGLTAAQVTGLVNAHLFGDDALDPIDYRVQGAGTVSGRTTRSGKVRVVLEAGDKAALMKLLKSLQKKLGA